MNEKLMWFNPDIQFMFHANIVEYDMKAMSVSISERYNLLDKPIIERLKRMPKEQRTREVGLMQRDNKEYSQRLIQCELETRRKFLEINNLDESNVVSLHSDACIFNSKKRIINNIEGVEFKHANTWSSYMRFKGIEMFYDGEVLEYKGVVKELLNQHTLGIHKYLCEVFNKLESYDGSVIDFISRFQMRYLQDRLPEQYYTSFGRVGEYKMSNLELFAFIANVVMKEVSGGGYSNG
jgi:hypothetical protein